jgi:NTP pyrophosphatase (non-canonical NTP hydrolase)
MSDNPEISGHLTVRELLEIVEIVDAHLDSSANPEYQAQPLGQDWARTTKCCEEAGEVWKAMSKLTGENSRKGICGTEAELLGEMGDTASAAICGIQHRTKDIDETWAVVCAAFLKARRRAAEGSSSPEGGA